MGLNFTNKEYFEKACKLAKAPSRESKLSVADAFGVLISDLRPGQLDNLYDEVKLLGIDCSDFSSLSEVDKKQAYDCAIKLIKAGKTLGSETVSDGKYNTSTWLSHCLWEGRLCSFFAKSMGLNPDYAEVMGMLHDYGRKESHTFEHVIRGFELLSDKGYEQEALACLTHSFLNGGRCANNDPVLEGFYVSADGMPCWKENTIKDEILVFLEEYEFDDYDRILNMSDLMAASSNILSPYDRILDIATRRTIDEINRGYFLAEVIRMIAYLSDKMKLDVDFSKYMNLRFTADKNIPQMMEILKEVSEEFYAKITDMALL